MFERLKSALIGPLTGFTATEQPRGATKADGSFDQAVAAEKAPEPDQDDAEPAKRNPFDARSIPLHLTADASSTIAALTDLHEESATAAQRDEAQARAMLVKLPRDTWRPALEVVRADHTRYLGVMLGEYTAMSALDKHLLRTAIAANPALYERAAASALLDWLLSGATDDPDELERLVAQRLRDMMNRAKARTGQITPALSRTQHAVVAGSVTGR